MKLIFNQIDLLEFDTVIFDLDNTIYDERQYLFKAYEQIARFCKSNFNIGFEESYEFLTNSFIREGRKQLFNKFCDKFNLELDKIGEFLGILRSVELDAKLLPFDYFIPLCRKLFYHNIQVAIITNGNPEQQINKMKQIEFNGLINSSHLIFANDTNPKPAIDSFLQLKDKIQINKALYIGDSTVDYYFALNCEIPFLNVVNLMS